MPQHLTDAIVKRLKAPEKGNKIHYDNKVKGFGVRVTAAGAKAFVLNYYTKLGRERRCTIGDSTEWSTKAARDEAKELRRKIDGGADPVGEGRDARQAPTVGDLCNRYLKEYAPLKRSAAADEMAIRIYIRPAFGTRKLVEVTRDDIVQLHRKISKGDGKRKPNPIRANRVVALLRKMFNLAGHWYLRQSETGELVPLRSDNPARGVVRNAEVQRKRYLKPDELERLIAALATYKDEQAANIVRLILLTGARSGEALGARWDQFDLEAGRWLKPASATKQKTDHEVPLSAPARQLLAELFAAKAKGAEFVFPGRDGVGHRVDLKKPWPAICKAAHIHGLRVHDLRHSYASFLVSAGLSLPVIGALLGHTQSQTTQRYAHLLDDPLRKATETVGAIVLGAAKGDVVDINHGRRHAKH
jgi:integrase